MVFCLFFILCVFWLVGCWLFCCCCCSVLGLFLCCFYRAGIKLLFWILREGFTSFFPIADITRWIMNMSQQRQWLWSRFESWPPVEIAGSRGKFRELSKKLFPFAIYSLPVTVALKKAADPGHESCEWCSFTTQHAFSLEEKARGTVLPQDQLLSLLMWRQGMAPCSPLHSSLGNAVTALPKDNWQTSDTGSKRSPLV